MAEECGGGGGPSASTGLKAVLDSALDNQSLYTSPHCRKGVSGKAWLLGNERMKLWMESRRCWKKKGGGGVVITEVEKREVRGGFMREKKE